MTKNSFATDYSNRLLVFTLEPPPHRKLLARGRNRENCARPVRVVVDIGMSSEVSNIAAIKIHHVDIMIPTPIGSEGNAITKR